MPLWVCSIQAKFQLVLISLEPTYHYFPSLFQFVPRVDDILGEVIDDVEPDGNIQMFRSILLITSWFIVAIFIFSGIALLCCKHILLANGFEKNMYIVILLSATHIDRSSVGRTPSKSRIDSMVSVRKSQTLFIMHLITSIVFSSPDIPFSSSSCFQLLENTSSPSTHLHPNLME